MQTPTPEPATVRHPRDATSRYQPSTPPQKALASKPNPAAPTSQEERPPPSPPSPTLDYPPGRAPWNVVSYTGAHLRRMLNTAWAYPTGVQNYIGLLSFMLAGGTNDGPDQLALLFFEDHALESQLHDVLRGAAGLPCPVWLLSPAGADSGAQCRVFIGEFRRGAEEWLMRMREGDGAVEETTTGELELELAIAELEYLWQAARRWDEDED